MMRRRRRAHRGDADGGARCRLLVPDRRVCSTAGICTVNSPNIDSAIATNSVAKVAMTQGFWNTACTCWPAAAAAAPAAV
jgi:hypothetical protein